MSSSPSARVHRRPSARRLLGRITTSLVAVHEIAPAVTTAALPLPGLGDLKRAIASITARIQDVPYEKSRTSALTFKLHSLNAIIEKSQELELDCLERVATEIDNISQDVDLTLAPSRPSFRRADDVLEALALLDKRLDDMVNIIQVELQLRNIAADELKQYGLVRLHEILDSVEIPPPEPAWYYDSELWRPIRYLELRREDIPTVSRRAGSNAEKHAKAVIDWHRRCAHPNVANVLGVTAARGLNGVVLGTASMSVTEFLMQVRSPRAFARYIEGIKGKKLYREVVRVGVDGRVTFTLGDSWFDSSSSDELWGLDTNQHYVSQAHRTCLKTVYYSTTLTKRGFLEQLALVTGELTELKVLQLVDYVGERPPDKWLYWLETAYPPIAIFEGDLGTVEGTATTGPEMLTTIKYWRLRSTHVTPVYEKLLGDTFVTYRWTEELDDIADGDATSQEGWDSTEAALRNERFMVTIYLDIYNWDWEARESFWARKMKGLSKVDVDTLCVAARVDYLIHVPCDPDAPIERPLYYHRRPYDRSNVRDFWGYLSFSSNPEDRDAGLEQNGCKIDHTVMVQYYKLSQDPGYKYNKLLRKMMKATPGSFPSPETEDEEKLCVLYDEE